MPRQLAPHHQTDMLLLQHHNNTHNHPLLPRKSHLHQLIHMHHRQSHRKISMLLHRTGLSQHLRTHTRPKDLPPPSQGSPQGSQPLPTGPPRRTAAPPPAKPKHPAGDRSHIPSSAQRMVDIFNSDMQRVASKAPPSFTPQVKDTQKRLNILFDHLNNEELVKPDTIQRLNELAEALTAELRRRG